MEAIYGFPVRKIAQKKFHDNKNFNTNSKSYNSQVRFNSGRFRKLNDDKWGQLSIYLLFGAVVHCEELVSFTRELGNEKM